MDIEIIAADRVQDGQGSFQVSEKLLSAARKKNLCVRTLEIVDLARRWEDKLGPDEFKSGASAMAAIEKARKLLGGKKADLVVIKGTDLLRSGYEGNSRSKYMRLYGKKFTPLEGYNKLVPLFLRHHHLTEDDYFRIRDELFRNYIRTWKSFKTGGHLPDERWMRPLTKYFRGVDCANPNVDYSAQMVLAPHRVADLLKVPRKNRVAIIGNAFTKLNIDGMESLPKVAPYRHLRKTIRKAVNEAGINFNEEFLAKKALLDAYTCYPVVPMGLLLSLGLVKSASEFPEFLKQYEVTVTGGLNLARAPWNLTSLNALIAMREKILSSRRYRTGLVHGNGSLGNQQGITILQKLPYYNGVRVLVSKTSL